MRSSLGKSNSYRFTHPLTDGIKQKGNHKKETRMRPTFQSAGKNNGAVITPRQTGEVWSEPVEDRSMHACVNWQIN